MGLEDRLSDEVAMLSGGQRQALSLIMATLNPPKILLLDEHTAALDPKIAKKIMEITDQLVRSYQPVTIMITHNLQDALAVGSRTLLLQQGKIAHDFQGLERQQLTPADLLAYF